MGSEEKLRKALRLLQTGDQAAGESILDMTRARIQVMIRARLGADNQCWHLIEDLTQDVQVALAAGLPTLTSPEPAAFRTFLSRLVQNKTADHFRREGRQPRPATRPITGTHPKSSPLDVLHSIPASIRSPSSDAGQLEQIDLVLEKMEELADRQREILTLAFFDELETAEIGAVMNLKRPAAAMLLLRAIRALEDRWRANSAESQ